MPKASLSLAMLEAPKSLSNLQETAQWLVEATTGIKGRMGSILRMDGALAAPLAKEWFARKWLAPTYVQTRVQTRFQTCAQTRVQTRFQTRAQARFQTRFQTRVQTRLQTCPAMHAQTRFQPCIQPSCC